MSAPPLASAPPLLEVRDLVHEYAVRGYGGTPAGVVHAVSGVSLQIGAGESVGLVGETGSGKSTLARAILQMPPPTSGQVLLRGVDLTRLRGRELIRARREIQMVFQDPFGSLDPSRRVASIVAEPLVASGASRAQRQRRVGELLELVGLDPGLFGRRRPRDLSGGQCQRVAIARALAVSPAIVICDEAVSSLDVLIQAQVLTLLADLRARLGLSYVFIAHDLALVKHVSNRVGVLYLGRMCEIGTAAEIYAEPAHPYTQALLSSVPSPVPGASRPRVGAAMSRETPSPVNPPSGCRFRTRCARAADLCARQAPPMRELTPGHSVACHFPLDEEARTQLRAGREAAVDPEPGPG
jgi:peptide/nickel transport system ATP-binding protein